MSVFVKLFSVILNFTHTLTYFFVEQGTKSNFRCYQWTKFDIPIYINARYIRKCKAINKN